MIAPEALASETADSDAHLPKPTQPLISQRIVKNETIGDLPRQQSYLESEFIGSNDVKVVTKAYSKRTDLADSYDVVTVFLTEHYLHSADPKPVGQGSYTISMTGIKGEIDGDRRLDTITTTTISPLGVTSEEPKQVRVHLTDPTTGMSNGERMTFFASRIKGGV